MQLSPNGKYTVWYEPRDSSFYAQSTDIHDMRFVSLTKKIPVSFHNEWHDTPSDPRPHGIAGWSEDDRFVYIYDRFDIWKLDPTGEKVPVNMTKTFGRRNLTRFRYVKLDKDLMKGAQIGLGHLAQEIVFCSLQIELQKIYVVNVQFLQPLDSSSIPHN